MRGASGRKSWVPAGKRGTNGARGSGGNGAGPRRRRGTKTMATRIGKQIDDLIQREQWDKARALIAKALVKEPDSHWLLTQLGETYYEQRDYKQALGLLLKSLDIVPDCPLTLWHLAGTLDALGYSSGALRLFTWLLRSKRTAADDPCWESTAWTDALKTDCVFRIGVCFQHLNRKDKATFYFRRYIDLLLAGAAGSYPIEDALRRIRQLGPGKRKAVEGELRKTAASATQVSGDAAAPTELPKLDRKRLRQLQEA
jgi:tetratricopeptide (TPR) repeat protein